jgi:hypothetical protein
MATYVNNLRLKEIATGAESGTWGTSTNTNLELIGDGLGYGTEQVAADSNETFTMADGAADGMRAMYLKFTSAGSLTATRELTLAPNTVSKFWIIENATTGSQIITIKQGSGATVNIANGAKKMVYTDGTGSGAAVYSANPGNGETGSGALVFGTSPTFVTPVLGTPASGTATNLTGLPPAGVVGTAAILGANTFTALQTEATGADIAAATTVDLTAATGNTVVITGTTTTTAFTMTAGQQMVLIAEAAWPLTFNATTMNITGGASYTCAAGDRLYVAKDIDNVIRVSVNKQDGTAVVSSGVSAGLSIALAMVMGF